jgi:hypothetical protein
MTKVRLTDDQIAKLINDGVRYCGIRGILVDRAGQTIPVTKDTVKRFREQEIERAYSSRRALIKRKEFYAIKN